MGSRRRSDFFYRGNVTLSAQCVVLAHTYRRGVHCHVQARKFTAHDFVQQQFAQCTKNAEGRAVDATASFVSVCGFVTSERITVHAHVPHHVFVLACKLLRQL